MKEIYFIRHGQTEYNKGGLVQGGGIDSSLNDRGRQQGVSFFERYQHLNFEIVLTSSLNRTMETVAPFLDAGLNTAVFPEINEMSWGEHEGKASNPAMHKEYLTLTSDWANGRFEARIKGGESAYELQDRLQFFLDHLKLRTEQKILVCTHGRVMKGICSLLKTGDLTEMEPYKHENTGLTIAQLNNGQFELITINDLAHLNQFTSNN